jgi:release factor glutamine methyltransferase
VTVLQAIQRSVDFLAKKGVESPRLNAELLLAHLLGQPRMNLYLNFERALTDAEESALRELVLRRGKREPLQHILGSACFCGLDLAVNRDVLIPRPETELLAELGWQFLERVAKECVSETPHALDLGTGSGCLAITLAVHCPTAQLTAVDVSPAALEVARQNAARHRVDTRIEFLAGDAFAALPKDARFDLIISNPPYIPSARIAGLEPEVRDHDPRLALDGGTDGLDFYRLIARKAAAFLRPHGRLMLEFGDGQEAALQTLLTGEKWIVEAIKADYNGRPRILVANRELLEGRILPVRT